MQKGRSICEEISALLKEIKGDQSDIAAAVYFLIMQTEQKKEAFQYFLENADIISSSETMQAERYFSASDFQKLERSCSQLIGGILDRLLAENTVPEDFYKKLWNQIFENESLDFGEEEKIYALYRIWRDGRIPYYQLEQGLKMSNEEFRRIANENRDILRKMIFIFNSNYEQKTERSSLILRTLDACASEENRVVLLSQILSLLEGRNRYW